MPFPTSYLQLALAHARNSRVKNGKRYAKSVEWLRTDQFKKNQGFIFQEKPLMSPLNILTCLKFNESKIWRKLKMLGVVCLSHSDLNFV